MCLRDNLLQPVAGPAAVLVLLGLATLSMRAQSGATITFPSLLPAGPDFATDVLGDPWDLSNPEDLSPDATETAHWISPTVSGGLFTGTTVTNDSGISLLHRGFYTIINPGKNGRNFPINTSKYKKLAFRISYSSANEQPQVIWFHNPWNDPASVSIGGLGASIGVQFPGRATAGYQVLVLDMTRTDVGVPWTAADLNGSTNVVGLRIDPNSGAVANNQVSLDWVRLTAADNDTANGAAMQSISWSGGSGTSTIDLFDSAGSTRLLTIASALSSSTTSYNWNYGVIPPGSYKLRVTRGGVAGPMKAFTINNPPIIQVTDPDETGGQDYATTVMGNAWNMDSLNDVQTYLNITAPSIVNGEYTATNTNSDPNLELLNNSASPIDTSKYRYLTYTLTVDGPDDLTNGNTARVFWTSATYLDGLTATTTKDIITWPGRHTYTIDLASLTTATDGGLEPLGMQEAWAPINKRFFRFDPHECDCEQAFHLGAVKLAAMDESNGSFTLKWAGYPYAPAAGATQVALYYDNDKDPSNGKTLIASALPMSSGSYPWDTASVTPGVYYIYAEASDGVQTYGRYSTGAIRVNNPTLTSIPVMSVDVPVGGATVVEPFLVGGWAIDQGAASGPGVDAVHVWAYPTTGAPPVFVAAAGYGGTRSDIGSIFGSSFAPSGFGVLVTSLPAGTYDLRAFAHSTVTGTFNQVRTAHITVAAPPSDPRMALDVPGSATTVPSAFMVAGWALDRAAASGPGVDAVHVWGFPLNGDGSLGAATFLGAAAYGSARADVGAVFGGQFTNSGFVLTIASLWPGPYRLAAFAHSTVSGTFNRVLTADVTVAGPLMAIDVPAPGAVQSGPFVVAGWALDRSAAQGPGVDAIAVWAYPVLSNGAYGSPIFAGSGGYGVPRADLAAIFGSQFANAGYGTWVALPAGTPRGVYDFVVYARSTVTGTFNQSMVVRVTVQ